FATCINLILPCRYERSGFTGENPLGILIRCTRNYSGVSYEGRVIQISQEISPLFIVAMNAAAPDGAPPRGGSTSLPRRARSSCELLTLRGSDEPLSPRRGPEAGSSRDWKIFMVVV